ncbi:NAD-dependent epimerase/dehydratase family protein [Streptomyces sp. NPDC046939]|uniref:NAD-dependent epimerase/dehydratase family protein n=1 Tax=Streptomyces sp. NPDC046939 TaxID=3155376 RepID=UPI003409FF14
MTTPTLFSLAPVAPPPWGRALVTAGAGFLGSHLCERLLDVGVDVDCVDDEATDPAHDLAHLADSPGFRFLPRDLARPGCPDSLAGPYDLVLHLVEPGADTTATRNALAVAERDGARFLLVSTCAQHASERRCEELTTGHAAAQEADAGIVRVFPLYGPRMGPRDGGGLIPALVRQALEGETVTVPGDGGATPSLCYVADAVDGILLVAASRSVRPVDIGGDPGATVERIARRVVELTGSRARLRFGGAPAGTDAAPLPQTGFAHELYGWTPRISWEDGLKRTVAAFFDELGRPGRSVS